MEGVLSFAVWLGSRVIPACLAFALTISITERALALDCLAYKPERAVGQWHAEVISGKICWQGPNWRSFLPKSKARVENSRLADSKPRMKVVKPKPDTLVATPRKTEVENNKPDAQIVMVENSKPDVQIENSMPETVPTSPLSEAADLYRTQDLSTVRKETAEFTNAASLKFNHKPAILKTDPPKTDEPQSVMELLFAFGIVALGTGALVMLIMRARSPQDISDIDVGEQPVEHILVDDELAPPLQPNSDEEHIVVKEPQLNS